MQLDLTAARHIVAGTTTNLAYGDARKETSSASAIRKVAPEALAAAAAAAFAHYMALSQ